MAFLMSLPFMFRSKVGDMKFSIPQSFLPGDKGERQGGPFGQCALRINSTIIFEPVLSAPIVQQ